MLTTKLPRKALSIAFVASASTIALSATPATAQSQQVSVASQPLNEALVEIGRRYGVSVYAPENLTRGKRSSRIAGDLTAKQAIERALAGTGLTAVRRPSGTFEVTRASAKNNSSPQNEPQESAANTADDEQQSSERIFGDVILVRGERPTQIRLTKADIPLIETPQAVSVIDRSILDALQIRDVRSALELVPGVNASSSRVSGPFAGGTGRFGGDGNFVLRGQTLSTSRDIRFDGFAGSAEAGAIDPFLYERIEVIRGPASSLYGPGSLGGFINRVPRKPEDDLSGSVGIQAGSFDTYRLQGDITGGLTDTGDISGRVTVVYENSGSFIDDVDRELISVAPSLKANLGDTTRVFIHGVLQEENGTPSPGIPLRTGPEGELIIPDVPRSFYFGDAADTSNDTSIRQIMVQGEQDIADDWLLSLAFFASNSELDTRFGNYGFGFYGDGDTYLYSAETQIESTSYAGELRLNGSFEAFGRTHDVLVGADFQDITRDQNTGFTYIGFANIYTDDLSQFTPAEPTPSPFGINTGVQGTLGAYAQVRLSLLESTKLIAGLRYDEADLSFSNQIDPIGNEATPSEVTYRIALTQNLAENIVAYGTYATTFVPVLSNSPTGEILDPETGEGVELGIKANWFDDRFSTNVAIYRQDRQDVPIALPPQQCVPPVFSCARSIGEQRNQGLEIEVIGRPLPGLTIAAAIAFQDNEITDENDPFAGLNTPGTTDRQTNFFANYEFQEGPLRGLGFGGTLISVGDRTALRPDRVADGYERLDLNFSYTGFERLVLQLNLRNVTDERYLENVDNTAFLNFFGAPRAFLFNATYRFGGG